MQAGLDLQAFMEELEKHFIDHPAVPAKRAENKERVETLVEDGILFLPNYVAKDKLQELYREIAWLPTALKEGRLGHVAAASKFAEHDWGLFQVFDVDQMCPVANLLKDDPVIQDIVQSYLADNANHHRSCVELRDGARDFEAFTEHMMPHFDNYYREVKVWLLLIDVGMSQGPMRYYTKTQRFASWRAVPEYQRYLGGLWKEASGIHPYALRLMRETNPDWADVEKVYCTGSAGTVIIADTRGIHRAWPTVPGNIRLDMWSDYRMDKIYRYH